MVTFSERRIRRILNPLDEGISMPVKHSTMGGFSSGIEEKGLAAPPSELMGGFMGEPLIVEPAPLPDQIQPASLEIRVGTEFWETDVLFTGFDRETLNRHSIIHKDNLDHGDEIICRPGYVYIVRSFESLKLPSTIEGISDTKSTVGRVGALSLVTDERFTHLRAGFSNNGCPGEIYFTVQPLAFPIILRVGQTRLIQIRFREVGTSYIDMETLRRVYGNENWVSLFHDDKLISPLDALDETGLRLTLDTDRIFVQKKHATEPLDLTLKNHYDPKKFWEEIRGNDEIVMEPETLYLFASRERIKLGANTCGFILRDDPVLGIGVRTHLAGLIDPGFNGRITLEYWSEKRRVIKNGQYGGKVLVEVMNPPAPVLYGAEELGSSYQMQDAPKLANIFKPFTAN